MMFLKHYLNTKKLQERTRGGTLLPGTNGSVHIFRKWPGVKYNMIGEMIIQLKVPIQKRIVKASEYTSDSKNLRLLWNYATINIVNYGVLSLILNMSYFIRIQVCTLLGREPWRDIPINYK